MAQASKMNDDRIWSAIEKSLDVLGSSKKLVLFHMAQMDADLSSIEGIERTLTRLLGEGAQIIIAPVRGQLKKDS
jgi:hypothetical protein